MAAKVVVYTTRTCGYCFAALRLLTNKGVAFENIDVTGDSKTRARLAQETGSYTVPQVFINGTSWGGYTDIAALDRSGRLDDLLAADPPD